MTNQKVEIKNCVCDCLSQLADGVFRDNGFTRKQGSTRYERTRSGCVQYIDVSLEHEPKDNPNAVAAIYPWLTVKIEQVDTVARTMTHEDAGLLSASTSTLQQPIELLAPKGIGARWYVYQPDSIHAAVLEFVVYSQKWVFSFLEVYANPEGVVSLFESKDPRVLNVQDQFMRVVASLALLGRYADAKVLLDDKFGRPAIRRKFASVFEYVEHELAGK